jgi:hypothetical protein
VELQNSCCLKENGDASQKRTRLAMTRSATARAPGPGGAAQGAPLQDARGHGGSFVSSGQDRTSLQVITPKKKKRRVRHFRAITKYAADVFHWVAEYFALEKQTGCAMNLQKAVDRTAAACQVSRTTVIKVRKCEDIEKWGVEVDHADKRAHVSDVPEEFVSIVHRMRDFFTTKKVMSTIDRLQEALEADAKSVASKHCEPEEPRLNWRWKRSTLHTFLTQHGFTFKLRKNHYDHQREREDIVVLRANYLEWVQMYRERGFCVFYPDEAWVFNNMSHGKVWQEDGGEIVYKVPSGSGNVPLSLIWALRKLVSWKVACFCTLMPKSNNNADYHSEMKASVFLDWLQKKVFPRMKEFSKKCRLVLDRATYHIRLTPHTMRMRKSYNEPVLMDALERWDGVPDEWPSNWRQSKTEAQLFWLCEAVTPPPKYLAQELVEKFESGDFNIKILMLPVAHLELNPIEHVWGIVKRTVGSQSFTHNLKEVERPTKMQIRSFTGPHGSGPNRTFGNFVRTP